MQALQPNDPRQIGAYVLRGRIGEGGQGLVYLAAAPDGTEVALKVLGSAMLGDTQARARFDREIQTARKVARFCTAQVLDADLNHQPPYVVSEYVAGPDLQSFVASKGLMSGADLERLAISTATALAAIHRAGIVHRDFKPGNVLMGPDGPRVIDFGIARAVQPGMSMASGVMGTPTYMSPEQFRGDRTGPESDMFAWAGTMLYAATGHPPFGQDQAASIMYRVLNGQPNLQGLPGGQLGRMIQQCLHRDPRARPTARTVLDHLLGEDQGGATPGGHRTVPPGGWPQTPAPMGGLQGGPQTLAPGSYPGSGGQPPKRNGLLIGAVAAAAVVLVGGIAGAVALKNQQDDPTPTNTSAGGPTAQPTGSAAPSTPAAANTAEATFRDDEACKMPTKATIQRLIPHAGIAKKYAVGEKGGAQQKAFCNFRGKSGLASAVIVVYSHYEERLAAPQPAKQLHQKKIGEFQDRDGEKETSPTGSITSNGDTRVLSGVGDEAFMQNVTTKKRGSKKDFANSVSVVSRIGNNNVMVAYTAFDGYLHTEKLKSTKDVEKGAQTIAKEIIKYLTE